MKFLKKYFPILLPLLLLLGWEMYQYGILQSLSRTAYDVCDEVSDAMGKEGCRPRYKRDFSLEWDEEVLLHDGRMIVVHIKRKFRRQFSNLEYERVWYLGTEISFDAGEPWGRYTRYFQGYDVGLIDTYKGKWYFKLTDATPGSGPNPRIVSQGHPYLELNIKGEKALNGPKELPHFPLNNVMRLLTSVKSVSKFDEEKLNWEEKIDFLEQGGMDYKIYMNVPLRDGMRKHVGITKHIGVKNDN